MNLNQAGIDLIKNAEGCKLEVYLDAVGLPTVGYGHMDKHMPVGGKLTQEQADELLQQDLDKVVAAITPLFKAQVSDNAFSACVSFAFNVGAHNFATSTMLKLINAGNFPWAALEFAKWDHAGQQVLPGLVARRRAEQELFLKG